MGYLNLSRRARGRVLAVAMAMTLGAAMLTVAATIPTSAAVGASVTVNVGQALAAIRSTAIGVNERCTTAT